MMNKEKGIINYSDTKNKHILNESKNNTMIMINKINNKQ